MSFLDNKSSLSFWTVFLLVLSIISVISTIYFGLQNSYISSQTASSGILAVGSLILAIFFFLCFIFLLIKNFSNNVKIGLLVVALLIVTVFGLYFIFLH